MKNRDKQFYTNTKLEEIYDLETDELLGYYDLETKELVWLDED